MEPVTADAALPPCDHLETEVHGLVAVFRISRPDKLNALTAAFWPQLRMLLDAAAAEPGIRAIVLTGSGDRAFSTGGDIEGFAELDGAAERRDFLDGCLRTFTAIEECRLPVIAAVNGWALGGGCELALACDIVLAAEHAAFGLPEASVGLVPGFGILRAPAVVGRQAAKLMVLAGERLSAQRAYELGLVQQVLPAAELVPAALKLGGRIAERAPLAVEVGKRMVNRGVDRGETGYGVEAVAMLYATQDAAEGIAAFAERREPRFEGR
ncbi:MAG TPA: enoyl-CoA hydratase/isomerase family protein [Streptosporangiaceae bacterium]|nr:enoyl-CoA hydratase/isomerase family protein [Streptosporangiaceae bacterium]